MSIHFDLLVKNGTCLLPDAEVQTHIGIRDGRIAAIGPAADASADRVIDATGLHVLPGLIDSQVHFREPGLEHKEDLATGTAGAALGGITAIFEMPNTRPSTTTKASIEDKFERAKGRAWVDHAFYVGAAASNIDQLPELEKLPGVSGVKIFMGASTGNLLVPDDETVGRVLASGKRRVAVHS